MTHPDVTFPHCSLPAPAKPKHMILSLLALISQSPRPVMLLEDPLRSFILAPGTSQLLCWLRASCGSLLPTAGLAVGLSASHKKYLGGKKYVCRHGLWKFPGMPAGSLSSLGSEFGTLSIP